MGFGRWDDERGATRAAYQAYTTSTYRKDGTSKDVKEVFTQRKIHESLDPKRINLRESRDSNENPNSRAIVAALDVTGSMGMIAHKMAQTGLGRLMEGILKDQPVKDPHLMFMAVGDETCDLAPLQVSQFEPDARIIEQLSNIFVEGGGGGNAYEGYHLPWYFLDKYSELDSWTKRNEKGYVFTIGDEPPPEKLRASDANRIFCSDLQTDLSTEQILKDVSERYHVFHLLIEQGSFCSGRGLNVASESWRNLLGKRLIMVDDYDYVPEIIIACIRVQEGEDIDNVIASFEDKKIRSTIQHALKQ